MKNISLFFSLLAVLFSATAVFATDIHISPTGSDKTGNGSRGAPFATLEHAAECIPLARADRKTTTIFLHTGAYRPAKQLQLGPRHSGTAAAPVIWRAAGDGPVRIYGAFPVPQNAIQLVRNPEILARLPKERDPNAQLFEISLRKSSIPELKPHGFGRSAPGSAWPALTLGEDPLTLASWPNGEGYSGGFKPGKVVNSGTTSKITTNGAASTKNTAKNHTMRFGAPPEKAALWRKAIEKYRASLWIGGHWYWDWADDFLPAIALDDAGTLTIGEKHAYGLGPHANLHAYNLLEEMDHSGEYAIEPENARIFVLLPPADIGKLSLSLKGEPLVSMKRAAFIRFENIGFGDTRGPAFQIEETREISFDHCEFTRIGDTAVSVRGEKIVFRDCEFTKLGASAVDLGGGDRPTLTHAENALEYCKIEDFGRLCRTYAPAVKISGVGNSVKNCNISQAPHSAIIFSGNEHCIANNDIHSVLLETGDCGAIYAGRDWTTHGTVISGNRIHDLGGRAGRWACGVYLDDQLSGITVKANLIDHAELGMMFGGGRHNIVQENIISHCKQGISADDRGLGWAKKHFPYMKGLLKDIPVDSEPWKTRYPMLSQTLTDRLGAPVGTKITNNAMVACRQPWMTRAAGGAATLSPNFEKLPESSLRQTPDSLEITGTPLKFPFPKTGPRKE